jgi:MFS family permease
MIYYRSIRHRSLDHVKLDIMIEMQSMMSTLNQSKSAKLSVSDFKTKHAGKAIAFGIFLMILNQFCGVFAMLNFTSTIFKESGSTMSPNVSSIVVGAIQIVGAFLCTFLVERAGRKSLLLISAFGISFGLAVLSAFIFASRSIDLGSFGFVPLSAFSFVVFISNFGVMTLPFLYVSEIVPTKIKEFTMMLCLSLLYVFATAVIQVENCCNLGMNVLTLFPCSTYRHSLQFSGCTERCFSSR